MPQEPKKRHSRARQGKRRSQIHLSIPAYVLCDNCKKPKAPHVVCKSCGYYDGRQILSLKTADKKDLPAGRQEETKTHEEEKRPAA